jgi:hypothetical protein
MTTTDLDQRARLRAALAPVEHPGLPDPPADTSGMRLKRVADVEATPRAGEFTARVSDFETDRDGEQFDRHSYDGIVAEIKAAGRTTPVIFSHTVSGLDSVLGGVPPGGWRITSDALLASGWLDVSTPVGQKIRNMLKRGALSWSIGFFDDRAARRTERNGTTTIGRVTDIVELSVVATPSNVRTTTSIKSSDGDELRRPTHTQLEQRLREEGIIARINPAIDLEDDVLLARLKARRNGGADLEDAEGKTASAAGARQAPITIATFRVD